ncbi:MAG: tRNA 2-thiouridine(34) synthase MnmA [Phycisphaerales bacterium]|nr:tRNA 2-thiouridine(34) synthase MnmA [Phycisphaerales bacterium]
MGAKKVVVAMSGGVDSSVTAALLVEQGYEVVGLFMRLGGATGDAPAGVAPHGAEPLSRRAHQGCCSAADAADARFVAGMLGVPFYALNFREDFDRIIEGFADEYAAGRTPNPCVECNNQLKFGRLIEYADAVGAEFVATGHYARLGRRDGRNVLSRAADAAKDQSYFLFGLDRRALDRVVFPLGGMTKDEVRRVARERGFPNCDKPDSVEICFVPERDYASVVRQRRPESFREGDVIDSEGRVIGRHSGIPGYTIGQRRGLGIALGEPAYVTRLNVLDNTVTLGPRGDLLSRGLLADRANFLIDAPDAFRADVKIRYLHRAAPASVERLDECHVRVTFDEPQSAVTPGQATVFYEGGVVLGGAWITAATGSGAANGGSADSAPGNTGSGADAAGTHFCPSSS